MKVFVITENDCGDSTVRAVSLSDRLAEKIRDTFEEECSNACTYKIEVYDTDDGEMIYAGYRYYIVRFWKDGEVCECSRPSVFSVSGQVEKPDYDGLGRVFVEVTAKSALDAIIAATEIRDEFLTKEKEKS